MRERASSVGGTLQAGPDPSGGYRVVAILPTDSSTESAEAEPGPVETGSRS
jgi:signal transduction histidine kinase